ncbi:hypothetical protein DV736_g1745, partial [Chaetothyriales sp. CBS 134916]
MSAAAAAAAATATRTAQSARHVLRHSRRSNVWQRAGLATAAPPVTQNATGARGPTAMVFLNMGGPSTTDEVGDFLTRLFADGDLIPLGRLQPYLGPLISKRRTPKIQKQYAEIGGGSPIRKWSEYQCEEMCRILDRTNPETAPHRPYVMFRYANPLTEDTYARMLADGFGNGRGGRAVAFTQYPQYSCSTTGSSLNELWKWRNRLEGKRATAAEDNAAGAITWTVIDRWPAHAGLVNAFAHNIEAKLAEYDEAERKDVVLLFSAHSLPMSVVNRGDPYPAEVAATVYAVMRRLDFSNPYRLCWQSQVGPSAWLGAQTSNTVKEYVGRGQHNLILVPIAFTSDHIETLYEIDKEVMHQDAHGHPGVKRADSLNGSPIFIKALADIASEHLRSGQACSRQMGLRCQGCRSERCLEQKKFFAGEQSRLLPAISANTTAVLLSSIHSALRDEYGSAIVPSLSADDWFFNNAGGAMGNMIILHASLTEYLIFFGTPLQTQGHSGVHLADDYFTILEGEQHTAHPNSLDPIIYRAGEQNHLRRGDAIHYVMPDKCFALELAQGWIPAMLPFGLADTFTSTFDFANLWKTVRLTVTRMAEQVTRGKF